MGFFKNMSALFRGKQAEKEAKENEVVTAPASLTNMKVGAFVDFGFLPEHENISGQSMSITATRTFNLGKFGKVTYAELDHGAYYIRQEKNKVEVLREFESNDAFLEVVDEDFYEMLQLDDDEWYEDDDGVRIVHNNETEFSLVDEFEFLTVGKYRTVRDVMAAKLDGQNVRFIRTASDDRQRFITVFYDEAGGDTYISGSFLINASDVEFNG